MKASSQCFFTTFFSGRSWNGINVNYIIKYVIILLYLLRNYTKIKMSFVHHFIHFLNKLLLYKLLYYICNFKNWDSFKMYYNKENWIDSKNYKVSLRSIIKTIKKGNICSNQRRIFGSKYNFQWSFVRILIESQTIGTQRVYILNRVFIFVYWVCLRSISMLLPKQFVGCTWGRHSLAWH